MHRVEASSPQYQAELDFKELKLWKKVAAVAFVTFASLFSLGFLFDTSFQYIVGRLSENKELPIAKKVAKVDLTKKRETISDEDKKKLEESFNEWFKKQNPSRFEASTKRKRAYKLASFFVAENKMGDNVKLVLTDILEARFKHEEELQRIANKPPSPRPIPKAPAPKKKRNPKAFSITSERTNSAGEKVIVKKKYERLTTGGGGNCGIHALLGVQKKGMVFADSHSGIRTEFVKHLENSELPSNITAQMEEVFEQLCNKQAYDIIKVLKPAFKAEFKNDKELKKINQRLSELFVQKTFTDDDKKEIEELETKLGEYQLKFYDQADVKAALVKHLKKTVEDCSEENLAEIIEKHHIALGKIFKWLCRDAKIDRSGIINDYIEMLKPIFDANYNSEIQDVLQKISAFEGINIKVLEPTAADERIKLIKACDAIKAKFVADPRVKAAFLERTKKVGVELFQEELVVLAKKENIPLILHQKYDGKEIATKYLNGEMVPSNSTYVDKDAAKKRKWVHVYYEGSHYERVIKHKTKVSLKD